MTNSVCLSWCYEPGFVGEHDGLDAVAEVELHEDPGDVSLDGAVADDELLGYLGVGEPARDEAKHLSLSGRELLELGRWSGRCGLEAERFDEPCGYLRREQGVAGCDNSHRANELF